MRSLAPWIEKNQLFIGLTLGGLGVGLNIVSLAIQVPAIISSAAIVLLVLALFYVASINVRSERDGVRIVSLICALFISGIGLAAILFS